MLSLLVQHAQLSKRLLTASRHRPAARRPALQMSLQGQHKKYQVQKKDISALHTRAKQALSRASARASQQQQQQQKQQLLAGAATAGARVGTEDEAVATSQTITAGAGICAGCHPVRNSTPGVARRRHFWACAPVKANLAARSCMRHGTPCRH